MSDPVLHDISNGMIQIRGKNRYTCCVIRSEREDERGLPKGCFINLDFFEKGNQNVGGLIHLPMKDISAHAKLFAQRGVRARPGLEDERGLPKGCSINLDFSVKGNQKVRWGHPSSHAGHISTRGTFRLKGVRGRPVLCVTFGSKLQLLLLFSAPLSLYIFIWREIKLTSLFGLIAGILKSNFGQGPVIVHSGLYRRHQRKVEIDLEGSDGR
ncbi:hypothetical protein CDAR_184421 [Caerostris darwini]|uniref:Uncharacterized protein n=1 Tax=Caerostris darwini TaxID=1538125 RepID=A0AAV4UFX7_9ARAC|nr:hypothetical protein CDAR_184421 [Caerostris darwini]